MDKKRERGVMLVISGLLHGLLALLPWEKKSPSLPVSSTPASPIRIIDASQLPTLPASESQSVPFSPPAPSVPTADPSPADLPPDAPIPEASDSSEPAPESDLKVDSIEDVPITGVSDGLESASESITAGSDTTPAQTPIDEAEIKANLEPLVSRLGAQGTKFETDALVSFFKVAASEEQVNQFFDEDDEPKFEAPSFYLFPDKKPEEVMSEITSNPDADFQLQQSFDVQRQEAFSDGLQETFPNGLAYELSLQGQPVRYLIIVRLLEDSVLMLSKSLPQLDP